MKNIKAIFWDNDGVLVDTEKLYFEANRLTYLKRDVDLTEEIYIEYLLKKALGAWHLLREKGCSEKEINLIREERNKLYSELLKEHAEPIDGVENVLKKFHGKIIMGVVTSSRKDHFESIHGRTGFKKYFDFILTSDDFEKVKPDPEPYLKALEISRMKKEDCIVVEDSERGLKAAVAAGIKCYIIPTHLTKNSNFTRAEKVLKNITEVIEIVGK
jgi:HAD superfamily hydrolase (TIGR01509 family)